jgi:glycosyltransferase involved in cell wall biosynthesis
MAVNVPLHEESVPLFHSFGEGATHALPVRAVLLTNCIAPYSLPMLRRLSSSLASFRILVSTPMERDRHWEPVWDGLNVTVQKSFTIAHRRFFQQGFSEALFRHFPYDSLAWLYRIRPQVIISAQLGFRTLQAILYRKLNPKCRLILWVDVSEHTEREIGRVRTGMRRRFLQAADAVLVNGASGEKYVERLGAPVERIVCAPYSTDIAGFAELPLTRDAVSARRLLHVGQLVERKGLEGFLRALARWAETHPNQRRELWFLGDGPLRHKLRSTRLPANLTLTFFGNVPYADLCKFYAHCGVLVLPTLADTWGLVVNEALAAGLPVFGSRYSQAVLELVRDGVNGWTFRPDRGQELERALDHMLSTDLATLTDMRKSARRTISHLTPEFASDRFLHAIRLITDASLPTLAGTSSTRLSAGNHD